MTPRVLFALVVATGITAFSCTTDPQQEGYINALGPEQPGVDPGEYHRAGQPCVVCHQSGGPGKGEFAFAGTIFYGQKKPIGVDGAEVVLVDSVNRPFRARTNCVGNFFIPMPAEETGRPQFPARVTVFFADNETNEKLEVAMSSPIGRDGSCASCHKIPAGLDSPGHVYLASGQKETARKYNGAPCRVPPVPAGFAVDGVQ